MAQILQGFMGVVKLGYCEDDDGVDRVMQTHSCKLCKCWFNVPKIFKRITHQQ